MKSTRLGSAGLGIHVVLIGLAIVLYLAFGNMGGKSYMKTVADSKKKAEDTVTHIYLNQIAQLVGMYELNHARYPNSMAELLADGNDAGAWSNDPWGTQYTISVDKNTKTVHITSAGPDTKFGNEDDQTFDQPIPM